MPTLTDSALTRLPIKLAINAAQKRRSPHTGFVHFCYNGKGEEYRETIPTLENFAYALALFRSKDLDHIAQGRKLLKRLLAFEVNGDFPLYLHEYPDCSSPSLSGHLLPALFWMVSTEMRPIIGADLLQPLHECFARCLETSRKKYQDDKLSWNARIKLLAVEGAFSPDQVEPLTSRDWGDFLMACSISGANPNRALMHWHSGLSVFTGTAGQRYEGNEPEVTLLDLFMGLYQGEMSTRAQKDQPVHLQAALVYPLESGFCDMALKGSVLELSDENYDYGLYWGSHERLHSLVSSRGPAECVVSGSEAKRELMLTLPSNPPLDKEDPIEWSCFLDRHPECEIKVNGNLANLFRLEDEVSITSPGCRVKLTFDLVEGEGTFCGHFFFGNRPSQVPSKRKPPSASYDWQIGLRTVKRTPHCKLKVTICRLD